MKIAFANAINADYEEDDNPMSEEEGKTTLFDQGWDGKLVFTDIKTVSEKQVSGGLVAGYIAPGAANLPKVVPIESSLARKDGGTWRKFDPAESQLPTRFISACFTTEVKRELKRIRDADPD